MKTKAYREKNPEKVKAAIKRWAAANLEHRRMYSRQRWKDHGDRLRPIAAAYRKRYREENPDLFRAQAKARYWADPHGQRLKVRARMYALTVEEVKTLLARTHCDLCDRPFDGKRLKPQIDHDHATGQVRGALCPRCNTMLGMLEESFDLIDKVVGYLRRHRRERAEVA